MTAVFHKTAEIRAQACETTNVFGVLRDQKVSDGANFVRVGSYSRGFNEVAKNGDLAATKVTLGGIQLETGPAEHIKNG